MNCSSCGNPATDGQITNWVTGRMTEDSNLESATSRVLVTTRTYFDFSPLAVLVCDACFAKEERRQKTFFWLFCGLAGFGLVFALYGMLGPSGSVLRIVLGVLALPAIVIGVGGAAHFSPVVRLRDADLHSHVTESFVRRIVRANGRDAFWTEEDFEANQQALLGS